MSFNDKNSSEEKTATTGSMENSEELDFVRVKVVGEGQSGVYFKLKRSTVFVKLKEYYSKHVGIPAESLKFLVDGNRIHDMDSPAKLNLKDDVQIDVYFVQTGGADIQR